MHNTRRRRGAEQDEMQPPTPLPTRNDLEHLLDGQPGRTDALAQLMNAARARGVRADTAGLQATMSAFGRLSYAPANANTSRRPSLIKTAAAKLAAAKLLLLTGAAVAATGGIALAATTGNLPNPLPHSTRAATTASAAVISGAEESAAHLSQSPATGSSASSGHPSAVPSPSLIGLCHSWLARPHTQGNADTNPAFTVLVTTAGGITSVDAYCTTLLAATPTDSSTSPTEVETSPSHPTGKPSDLPSAAQTHPTGKPSDLPSAAQTHPTGKPSS
jgi:hypothetical protein